jgi:uracil-DNA glycosylase family 4
MTDTNPPGEGLAADEIKAQAAALAAHLDRSGIHWLPNPRPDAVQSLAKNFARPTAADDSTEHESADTTDPNKPSEKSSRPAPTQSAPQRPAATRPATRLDPVASIEAVGSTYPQAAIPINDRQAQLDLINQQVSGCTRCEILSSCRKKTVFGEGSVSPRVVFFGEGPGADEDNTGRPFVGRAGELLTRMIQACSFAREDVYLLNTVKCRPPGNRNPEPDEIENCREYYQRQLAILRPQYIVCLGAISSQELLKSKLPVGRLRGRFHAYFESKVVVTYHPAYLLRNDSAKKAAWADLQLMLQDAGIQLG